MINKSLDQTLHAESSAELDEVEKLFILPHAMLF